MRVIQISSDKIEHLGNLTEKMLRYGGKVMQCVEELKEHGSYGERDDFDFDERDDFDERGGYGERGDYGERRGVRGTGRYSRYYRR